MGLEARQNHPSTRPPLTGEQRHRVAAACAYLLTESDFDLSKFVNTVDLLIGGEEERGRIRTNPIRDGEKRIVLTTYDPKQSRPIITVDDLGKKIQEQVSVRSERSTETGTTRNVITVTYTAPRDPVPGYVSYSTGKNVTFEHEGSRFEEATAEQARELAQKIFIASQNPSMQHTP